MALQRSDFIDLIPHDGTMCLIDRVESWDDQTLRATTASHRRADHPLARDGRLAAIHGLEYGAQAMAIHGALLAQRCGEALPPGYLAGARGVELHTARLDVVTADLVIAVRCEFAQAGNLIYAFRVEAGEELLMSGTATVVSR